MQNLYQEFKVITAPDPFSTQTTVKLNEAL